MPDGAHLALTDPTLEVELRFDRYLAERQGQLAAHLEGGVPDYAFALDCTLRRRLNAIRPLRSLTRALVSAMVPIQKQIQQMQGVAVGPRQLPEIHAMGERCARRLGIGVPQIFVCQNPTLSAYTIATDDTAPMVVVSSGLIEAMEPLELEFVIGHECGHIHNLHGVYNTAAVLMVNPLARAMLQQLAAAGVSLGVVALAAQAVQGAVQLFLLSWSRAAEVTCDRAGLICCGDLRASQLALARLAVGGGERMQGFDLEEYVRQISAVRSTPLKLMELFQTHPLLPKRIEALRLFSSSSVLAKWRPEMAGAARPRSKEETDAECEQVVKVLGRGGEAR